MPELIVAGAAIASLGSFFAGVLVTERASRRDHELERSRNCDAYDRLENEIADNIDLRVRNLELENEKAALARQNRALATQRFQLLQGGRTA